MFSNIGGLLVLQADVFIPLGIGNLVKRHLFQCNEQERISSTFFEVFQVLLT